MSQYGRGYYTSSTSSSSMQKPVAAAPFYNFVNGDDDFEYDTSDSNQYSNSSCGYKRSSFDIDHDFISNGNSSKRLRTENHSYHGTQNNVFKNGYSSGNKSYATSYNNTSDKSSEEARYRQNFNSANQEKFSFSYSNRTNFTNQTSTSIVPQRLSESPPASCSLSVQQQTSSSSPPSSSSGFRVSPELSMPVFQTLDRSDSWTSQMNRQSIKKKTVVDTITAR